MQLKLFCNLKLLVLILLFSCAFNVSYAQEFEGLLTYKADVEVLPTLKKIGITNEIFKKNMVREGTWYDTLIIMYDNKGFYRVQFGTNFKTWSIYRPDSNKIYTIYDSIDICRSIDASIDLETTVTKQKPKIELIDTTVIINNKICKIVRVKWKSGYYDYFFSKNYLPINPSLYKGHIYDGWYEYLKIANCLPVQIIKVTKDMMKITYTLINTKAEKIDTNLFILPKLIPSDYQELTKLSNTLTYRIQRDDKTNIDLKKFPKPIGRTNDFENILTPSQIDTLNSTLNQFEKLTSNKILVVTIDSTELNKDEETYAGDLLDDWEGENIRGNCLVILLSKSGRDVRISGGLEAKKIFTDSLQVQIINQEMVPYFKVGKYYEGLQRGVLKIIKIWNNK